MAAETNPDAAEFRPLTDFPGLQLNAIIETAPLDNVRAIAQSLDDERAAGKVRSPLHGVPIIVKDSKFILRLTKAQDR